MTKVRLAYSPKELRILSLSEDRSRLVDNGTDRSFHTEHNARNDHSPWARKGEDNEEAIGWHSFRHSLATNLRSMGVDVRVAQELLRHAKSRVTMDFYTQAVSADKRLASGRQINMLSKAQREGSPPL